MSRWVRIRESFWFLPGVLCALAVVLAETLIVVDRRVDDLSIGPFAVLVNQIGAAGSRDVLGAIAGSMLTVAATTFSITIAVLTLASSTYGPRLVRNFMADRGNQFVLGVYVATFLYSLLVLRSIRELDGQGETFVPHLAVNVAVLLALLSIGVLVYFINHITDSVQVWTLARQVRTELVAAVDRLYPEEIGRAPEEVQDVPDRMGAESVAVLADDTGYVQSLKPRLLEVAEQHDVVVSLRVRPGSHVIDGTHLAVLWPPDRADVELHREIRATIEIGQARAPHQDVEFAVMILEEMAVRALSPGTNDPYTALNALDDLAAGLTRLAGRTMPSPYRYDEQGGLRVIAPHVSFTDLLNQVFDAMRIYAIEHPTVLRRTLELAEQVGAASRTPVVRDLLDAHVSAILAAYERTSPQERDLGRLQTRAAEVRQELATRL